jgi:hypothetical protein
MKQVKRLGILGGALLAFSFLKPNNFSVFASTDVNQANVCKEEENPFSLVQVQMIVRHGLRTPMSGSMPEKYKQYNWQCDTKVDDNLFILDNKEDGSIHKMRFQEYFASHLEDVNKLFGTCAIEQLTNEGGLQTERVGKFLRKRYVDELKFLPNYYHPEVMNFRSTDTERTIWTTRQVLHGLYPKEYRSPADITAINIKQIENMYPNDCILLQEMRRDNRKSPEAREKSKKAREIFNQIEDEKERKYWQTRSLSGICNNLQSFHHHKFQLPSGISFEEINLFCQLSGMDYSSTYQDPKFSRLGIGRFAGDLLTNIQKTQQLNKKIRHPKFYIFAGHDNTLGPLMNSLKGC